MKYAALTLAGLLLFSLVSCTPPEEEDSTTLNYTAGVVLTGKPFAFLDEQGELMGLEPELLRRMCENSKDILELKVVTEEEACQGLLNGSLSVAVGRFVRQTPEEEGAALHYTDHYLTVYQAVLVPTRTDIKRLDDLEGYRVGVLAGSEGDKVISAREGVFVRRYDNGGEAIDALLKGEIEAVVVNNFLAEDYLAQYEDEIDELGDRLEVKEYAILTKAIPTSFEFNNSLSRARGSGLVVELLKKYHEDFVREFQ